MRQLILGLLVWFSAGASIAQAAQNVDGFPALGFAGTGFKVVDVSSGPSDVGRVLRIQPDGKLLMAGTCQSLEEFSQPKFCATRLDRDGNYDSSFGFDGTVRFDRFEPQGIPKYTNLSDMVRLKDGRILFMGGDYIVDGEILLAILTADGRTLDPGVVGGTGFIRFKYGATNNSSFGNVVLEQADGKILVAGMMDRSGSTGSYYDMTVQRFLPDLSVDKNFGNQGYQIIPSSFSGGPDNFTTAANSVAVQTNGSIVLAGNERTSVSTSQVAIVRLLQNGQLDSEFGPGSDGRVYLTSSDFDVANTVRFDQQGRIVVAGYTAGDTNPSSRSGLINRLLANGSQDFSFNASAGVGHPQTFTVPVGSSNAPCNIVDLALPADGTVLAVGSVLDYYFTAVRLTPSGAFDSTFGVGGKSYGSFESSASRTVVRSGAIAIGSGLMIAGASTGSDTKFGIAKLILDKVFANGFEN